MWQYHTEEKNWSDIAQHVSIGPDGKIWLCRNFNRAPASAYGFNGNSHSGPFMIEIIGDFDPARDTLTEEQLSATLAVIKSVQDYHGLRPQDLRFHNEMSGHKSCPGRSLEKNKIVKQVREYQFEPKTRPKNASSPFSERSSRIFQLIQNLSSSAVRDNEDMSRAEHPVGYEVLEGSRSSRGGKRILTSEMLIELKHHVINLRQGKFSESGKLETRPGDVDAMFEEQLPQEIEAAKARGEKARVLFFAHGGLVSEENGLLGAYDQLKFWRANHVYPIYFIWETGLGEVIGDLVKRALGRVSGSRGITDWIGGAVSGVTDELIEEVVRVLGGKIIWAGMQSSARAASAQNGGAEYVADKAARFFNDNKKSVEFHTAGHSAGSILQAYFMPRLVESKVEITTAHYLAPAIRNDLFHKLVAPHLGKKIGPLTIYTMQKELEKDDNVIMVYRKSLLYLIYEALENRRNTDILGLEVSLRGDDKARDIFGLRGTRSDKGEVVWSKSYDASTGGSSLSTTHGGFDNDRATMESIARRILDRRIGQPIEPFPESSSRSTEDIWNNQLDWPESLDNFNLSSSAPMVPNQAQLHSMQMSSSSPSINRRGNRTSLCVGINSYQGNPLYGCVADANLWANTLSNQGFTAELLLEDQATAAAIRANLASMINNSQPGDHLVFQFAGHGTQFDDISGDEAGGDTPDKDECLCAYDVGSGIDGLVIDDQLREIISRMPQGVNLTCFMDCCHSGSNTRAMFAASNSNRSDLDRRARFLNPTPAMRSAYEHLHSRNSNQQSSKRNMREVSFSACRSSQLAYESQGHGEFTLRANQTIASEGINLTNRDFHNLVIQAFGSNPQQNPELDCDPAGFNWQFLGSG